LTTKTGTTPSQGDIVLIPIPFTDLSSRKRRPVVVVSNDEYNRTFDDIVVVAMTSNPRLGPHSIRITTDDLVRGKLNRPGTIRVDKIYTLSQSIVVTTFGRVSPGVLDRIRSVLHELTGTEPQG